MENLSGWVLNTWRPIFGWNDRSIAGEYSEQRFSRYFRSHPVRFHDERSAGVRCTAAYAVRVDARDETRARAQRSRRTFRSTRTLAMYLRTDKPCSTCFVTCIRSLRFRSRTTKMNKEQICIILLKIKLTPPGYKYIPLGVSDYYT